MNSFDPSILKIMTTYRCRYVFKKMSRGKLGKAAHELSGIVGTLNLLQRAFLFKYVRCRGPICFGERRKPSVAWGRKKKKKAMEPLHFLCIKWAMNIDNKYPRFINACFMQISFGGTQSSFLNKAIVNRGLFAWVCATAEQAICMKAHRRVWTNWSHQIGTSQSSVI